VPQAGDLVELMPEVILDLPDGLLAVEAIDEVDGDGALARVRPEPTEMTLASEPIMAMEDSTPGGRSGTRG